MSSRERKKKKPNSKSQRAKKQRGGVNADSDRAHTSISRPVGGPDRMRVRLRYPIEALIFNAASTRVSKRWYTNALYDVDPVLLSTTIPWFSEWSLMYSYNRVLSYTVSVSLSNLEAFPVAIYFVHTPTDPGTGGVNFNNYANGPLGRQIQLSGASAQLSKITTMSHSVRQVVGDQIVMTDNTYVGTASSNPTDLTYFAVGVQSPLTNLNNGVYVSGHIEFHCEFFDRKVLAAFAYVPPPFSVEEFNDAYKIYQLSVRDGKQVPSEVKEKVDKYVAWKSSRTQ